MITRRALAAGLGGLALGIGATRACAAPGWTSALAPRLHEIEQTSGGRLGVAVTDTKTGEAADYRGSERFPMCSTSKALIVGGILSQVDAGAIKLADLVAVRPSDLLSYAPETRKHVGSTMSIGAICEAAITLSDNTAANLLIERLGGPAGVTAFIRKLGDDTTRLDRTEPTLNTALHDDPRDTTTPTAMAIDLRKLTMGTILSDGQRNALVQWLIDCKTDGARLRAGVPTTWRAGDKTGTGERGTIGDVAILWPGDDNALIVTSYLTEAKGDDKARDAVLASVGRAVADAYRG